MNPMITPKFDKLPQELQSEIIARAKEIGAYKAAEEYYQEANMSVGGLHLRLKKALGNVSWGSEFMSKGEGKVLEPKPKVGNRERNLTKEEKGFLKKLESGEITFEETSRFVAVRVFERMLKNPDRWQYLDFFRTELIKVKREEAQIKDAWAKEIIARVFSGKLPPKNCPHCGKDILGEKVIEGEVVNNGQKRIIGSI